MSVTIVTSVPALAQNTTTGSASIAGGDAANAPDFLSLLIGQLAPAATAPVVETATTSDIPQESDELATNADALIAALGITPSIQVSNGDTSASRTVTGKTDPESALGSAPVVRSTLPGTAEDFVSGSTAEPTQSLQNSKVDAALGDDKAAKFAVSPPVTPIVEKTLIQTSSETTSNNIAALANNNPLAPARHNDAAVSVQTPIRDQNWASDFSQKIVWLASNDKQSAQITLNPAQMGPIEISLNVDKGNATASFVSVNADVREAIESALPRLREMFASAGIELGQTNVSAESFKQQADSESRGTARAGTDNAILAAESTGTVSVSAFATQRGNGMVDLFA